jgi:tRNA modification GTPase
MQFRNEQTICAISTAYGQGGIAVIRVSGPQALEISKKIIPKLDQKKIESHKAYFVEVLDSKRNKVDEVITTYFSKGRSFTGDEVVEISCHGSTYISQKILDLLIENGCFLADRGEFTFRAFMNNRIDLVQAESVLSLIESQNELSAKVALRQLDGHVSKSFDRLESELTWCLAHIEASIDFSTEGIDVVDTYVLIQKLKSIKAEVDQLNETYKAGKLLKEGVKLVLLGKPNAGKSSLLNLLVQDEKAIVTEVAGTTRDVIEAKTVFGGVQFQISDTAGLRETKDQVELIGVDRSKKEALKADVLCVVLGLDEQETWSETLNMARKLGASKILYLVNKSDLFKNVQVDDVRKKLQSIIDGLDPKSVLLTSHLDSGTRSRVLSGAKEIVGDLSYLDQAIISSARQFEGAQYCSQMIERSLVELEQEIGAEFVAMYLKEALVSLQRILGKVYDDQILDRVFKEFCLGK